MPLQCTCTYNVFDVHDLLEHRLHAMWLHVRQHYWHSLSFSLNIMPMVEGLGQEGRSMWWGTIHEPHWLGNVSV